MKVKPADGAGEADLEALNNFFKKASEERQDEEDNFKHKKTKYHNMKRLQTSQGPRTIKYMSE